MARNFNGTDGYLHAATAVATGAPLTMVCWFRKTGTASSPQELVCLSDASEHDQMFILSAGDGSDAVVFAGPYAGGVWDPAVATASFAAGQWHHAAAVFVSSSERHAYLDGANKGSSSAVITPTGQDRTSIGRAILSTPTAYFAGDIAEVAIWNTALSDAEIAILGHGFSPLCLTHRLPNLVLYQDLIRPLDHPGVGPALTASGGTTAAPHPRMIYPQSLALAAVLRQVQFLDFYRVSAAQAHASAVQQGWAAVSGANQGAILPIGEVAN
jgi:Concanavalin A-like lectin/glucanases superfamily